MLALVVMLIGGAATFFTAHSYKAQWARSGQALQFGQDYEIPLSVDQNPLLIYYETANPDASSGDVVLTVYDPFGDRIQRVPRPTGDHNFEIGGWHGYAAYELPVDETGTYRFKARHIGFGSDDDVPEADRVVVLKTPPKRDDALANYRVILVIGASITVVLAVALYIVHGITLSKAGSR